MIWAVYKVKLAIILAAEYGIFALKINCESQKYTYQVEANQQYRILQYATEWKLHSELFDKIVDKFRRLGIDLFATRINRLVRVRAFASRTKRLWQLMPSVSSGVTTIFTIFGLLV